MIKLKGENGKELVTNDDKRQLRSSFPFVVVFQKENKVALSFLQDLVSESPLIKKSKPTQLMKVKLNKTSRWPNNTPHKSSIFVDCSDFKT